MTDLESILTNLFPSTEERVEGKLVYLKKYGLTRLDLPGLEQKTNLNFYKGTFFTGYRKYSKIEVIIAIVRGNKEIFLLTNPVFSTKYSNLVEQLEKILQKDIDQQLINEIIEIYKEAGTNITVLNARDNLYQIWVGKNKWRTMQIKSNNTLAIITVPNFSTGSNFISRLKNLFGA